MSKKPETFSTADEKFQGAKVAMPTRKEGTATTSAPESSSQATQRTSIQEPIYTEIKEDTIIVEEINNHLEVDHNFKQNLDQVKEDAPISRKTMFTHQDRLYPDTDRCHQVLQFIHFNLNHVQESHHFNQDHKLINQEQITMFNMWKIWTYRK